MTDATIKALRAGKPATIVGTAADGVRVYPTLPGGLAGVGLHVTAPDGRAILTADDLDRLIAALIVVREGMTHGDRDDRGPDA